VTVTINGAKVTRRPETQQDLRARPALPPPNATALGRFFYGHLQKFPKSEITAQLSQRFSPKNVPFPPL
jgi:hypothetical protein